MTHDDNKALATAFFEDLATGRIEKAITRLDPGGTFWFNERPLNRPARATRSMGVLHDGLRKVADDELPIPLDGMHVARMTAEGDQVAVEVHNVSPFPDGREVDEVYDQAYVWMLHITDGHIADVRLYVDTYYRSRVFPELYGESGDAAVAAVAAKHAAVADATFPLAVSDPRTEETKRVFRTWSDANNRGTSDALDLLDDDGVSWIGLRFPRSSTGRSARVGVGPLSVIKDELVAIHAHELPIAVVGGWHLVNLLAEGDYCVAEVVNRSAFHDDRPEAYYDMAYCFTARIVDEKIRYFGEIPDTLYASQVFPEQFAVGDGDAVPDELPAADLLNTAGGAEIWCRTCAERG